jgi:cyclopropane-fatty-acyl-phospholipid synthase
MDTSKAISPYSSDMSQLSSWDRLFVHALRNVKGGVLRVRFANGHLVEVGQGVEDAVDLILLEEGLPKTFLFRGAMGFAEAYIQGQWRTSDLSALLRILARSQEQLGRFARGTSHIIRWMDRMSHKLRRNTKDNARRNIQEHYDLSNEMYQTFLDSTMTYSSGIFEGPSDTLHTAQLRKLDRLIETLKLTASDHVLEIGSGWGSCAIRMAQQSGCRVTSVTLSERQAEEARRRVREAGLEDRVEIRIQDYRDVKEIFDHAISIEMIEAVGHEYLPGYFQTVYDRLKPGGRFALQAITIPDERYASYNKSCDFIQKHIFPGGHLPCPGQLSELAENRVGFKMESQLEFGKDYAETLRRWTFNFFAKLADVQDLGFNEAFIRKWHYYLAYCEAGFDTGLIHVRQISYKKSDHS